MAHGVVFRCCVCCLLMVSLPLNAACFAELFLWRLEQEPAIQCVKQRGGHLMCVWLFLIQLMGGGGGRVVRVRPREAEQS